MIIFLTAFLTWYNIEYTIIENTVIIFRDFIIQICRIISITIFISQILLDEDGGVPFLLNFTLTGGFAKNDSGLLTIQEHSFLLFCGAIICLLLAVMKLLLSSEKKIYSSFDYDIVFLIFCFK